MINSKRIKLALVFLFVILLMCSSVLATYYRSATQYIQTGPYGAIGAFTGFPREQCEAGQDFIIQIAPFSCTPAVVRSDLLEEQNVPVFCQLSATNLNPLIDVETIDAISITGKYPKEVASVGFYPAQSALGYSGDVTSPVMNNIGYVVIILRQQKNESAMPEVVTGNLTARIRYDVTNAFGVGRATFYLPEYDDSEWGQKYRQYSFWDGRGYLRAEGIDEDGAVISIYSGQYQRTLTGTTSQKQRYSTTDLVKGETSEEIYIPGFDYCLATLNLKLEDIENPDTRARFEINGEIFEVAEKEGFLDNKCRVRKITEEGLNKIVKINCREDKKSSTFDLKIIPKIKLNIAGLGEKEVGVGEFLYQTEDRKKSVYLGYIGTEQNTGELEDLYAYLIAIPEQKDKLSEDEIASVASIVEQLRGKGITGIPAVSNFLDFQLKEIAYFRQIINRLISGDSFLMPLKYSEGLKDIKGTQVSIEGFAGATDAELSKESEEYFNNAIENYQTIIESFPDEENPLEDTVTLGEKALYDVILLAEALGQKKTMLDFCENFREEYPNSEKNLDMCDDGLKISNSEISSREVTINGKIKKISFEDVYEPSYKEYSAEIKVKSPNGITRFLTIRKNEIIYLDDSEKEYIQLVDLETDAAVINTNLVPKGFWNTLKEPVTSDKKTLRLDVVDSLDSNYEFTLTEVNLKKVAKVSIIPNVDYARTEADFNFKIEIEKRGIQLAPEKAKEKIEKLDNSIREWKKISDSLGTVVKSMKTACLGTAAVLTIKNFFANTGGKGIARQRVMREEGGWYELCASYVNAGKYTTQEQCLLDNSDKIDADVNKLYSVLHEDNTEIKKLNEQSMEKNGLFSGDFVNTSKFMHLYIPNVQQDITLLGDEFQGIDMEKMKKSLSYESWTNNNYELEEMRDIQLYTGILNDKQASSELKSLAQKQLYSIFSDIEINSENYLERTATADKLGISSEKVNTLEISWNVKKLPYKGLIYENIKTNLPNFGINDKTPVATLQTLPDGKEYILVLDDSSGKKNLPIKTDEAHNLMIYDSSGNLVSEENIPNQMKNLYFQKYDFESYKNEYENPEIKYYETGSYKGYPAIVPFDLKNGWYASLKETLSVFSSIKTYEESGKVMSFYLCNVGENKLEENLEGDDICELINLGISESYQFPGLDEKETSKLINNAVKAVSEAQRQRKNNEGIKRANILGQKVDVGNPAVDVPEIQCQDFMSPKECNILFNVCDPVVCPTSRCNFGGNYYVQDVAQSGIIGSIALCLPNYREKIYIPVCLTGVAAGIDGWLSIQESYRDCLQESLDTGETVGICDKIYSIYGCEFFWRQAIPLAKFGIPKLTGIILGQNARGGGEYLGVADAWKKTEKAVTYFTQYYAQNSYKAFKARSAEEIGGEICKVFASVTYPETGDLLDTITTPDSPPQFHGWFDEIPFTTVTTPAYSQYKVYYHIYAGKDTGAYYRVYLKGNAGSSFYQDTVISVLVDTGYISKGEYTSETKDFTAPSGYQQLCIMVNGQEECGFKEVSTSFAVDYIQEKYVASQADEIDIKTEEECISGSASIYSLLNPNIQEGVGDLINPEIYNQGIVRVCATKNPGQKTDANAGMNGSRWVEVGYCGSKNLKCWLDTESVKKVLDFSNLEENVLETTTTNYLEVLKNAGNYLSEEEFDNAINQINKESSNIEKITLINNFIDRVFLNSEKAYLLLLKASAYGKLATEEYSVIKSEETESSESETEEESIREKKIKIDVVKIVTSPKFEIRRGILTRNFCARYFQEQWYWSLDCDNVGREVKELRGFLTTVTTASSNWIPVTSLENTAGRDPDKETQELIKSLRNVDFEQGLGILLDKAIKERALIGGNAEMSDEKIFTLDFKDLRNLKFKYSSQEKSWMWAYRAVKDTLEGAWQPVTKTTNPILTASKLNFAQKELLASLEGKDFFNGAIELFWIGFDAGEVEEKYFGLTDSENGLSEIPGGETCEIVEPLEEVETITDPQKKVLKAASVLKGTSSSGFEDCFDSATYVYKKANVNLGGCIYSDNKGKNYNIEEETITIGVDKNSKNQIIFQVASNPSDSCTLNRGNAEIEEFDKLNALEPGYMLSYAYCSDAGHNAIFVGWVDKNTKTAKLFDWNGPGRTFRYYDEDLSDAEHPVYMFWEPV